jgi:phage I-like protein
MKPLLDATFTLPQDGWFHALALGEFPNSLHAMGPDGKPRRAKVVQVIDKAATEGMVAAFNRASAAPEFPGLLVDRDHESDDPDKTTDAWGWCMGLENRDDGLWCKIRWTDLGEPAVRGGRFRFLSAVFDPAACEDLGNGRLRPLRLEKLGLTNDPNIRPLRPLSNSANSAPLREFSISNNAPADSGKDSPGTGGKESTMDYKAELLAMLGLPAEATDEQIAAGCAARKTEMENRAAEREQLQNRAEAAEAKANELDTWKTGRLRADLEVQVEQDLETHKDVIANRDEVKAQLLANRDGTLKVLVSLRKPAPAQEPPPALRNRATKAPDGLTDEDRALRNRRAEQDRVIEEARTKYRCPTRAAAIERAQAEHPELFGK